MARDEKRQQVGRGLLEGDNQPGLRLLGLELAPPLVERFGRGADGLLGDEARVGAHEHHGHGGVGAVEGDEQIEGCDCVGGNHELDSGWFVSRFCGAAT